MNSERYNRMKDIFVKAAEAAPDERIALLEHECAEDAELRREVELLLKHHDTPTSGIDAPTSTITDRPPSTHALPSAFRRQEEMPKQVGNYRMVRELGRGGMGLVYLGVREEGRFQRRVAIKVIKKGMDTDDVLRRFELERQLLSALNHNNIARLYDAGTTEDGRPYFALEYVEGVPLDTYCDRNRLSIDERLDLFKQVCSALAYAHRNLVVHRDIKPANIIVTSEGTVKLLDFGIAKLLNPELSLGGGDITAKEMRVMTPEYASPEQVRGEQITTASDVYSLGVLLYELLTGHRPYRIKERVRSEIERVICEMEPERPSTAISKIEELPDRSTSVPGSKPGGGYTTRTVTPESVSATRNARPDSLRRRLAGDIDNIIMMAMRKEPMRRYSSVEKLMEDIDRHLSGMPVAARPSSIMYRTSKFVRRNKAGMAIAALLIVAASAALGMAWTGKTAMAATAVAEAERSKAAEATAVAAAADARADAEQERSQRRAMVLRELSRDFLFTFHDEILQLEGSMGARQMLVATALEQLEEIERDQLAADDPELQRELADAYARWGDVQGGKHTGNLGDTEGAEKSYTRALELYEALVENHPENSQYKHGLAATYERMANLMWILGRGEESGRFNRLRGDLAAQLFAAARDDLNTRRRYATSLAALGDEFVKVGDHASAIKYHSEALEHSRIVLAGLMEMDQNHRNLPRMRRDVTFAMMRLAFRNLEACRYEEAMQFAQQAADTRREQWEEETWNARYRRDLGFSLYVIGHLYLKMKDYDRAALFIEETRTHYEHLAEAEPSDVRGLVDRAAVYEEVGEIRMHRGDIDGALEAYKTFNRHAIDLAQMDQHNAIVSLVLSKSHEALGRLHLARGEFHEAARQYREAILTMRLLTQDAPADVRRREDLARQQVGLAEALMRRNAGAADVQEAQQLLDDSAATCRELLVLHPENCERQEMLEKIDDHLRKLGVTR